MKCGIDLGTTFSVISWYDDVNKRLVTIDLNCEDGQRTLRSVVYYPGQGQDPVVGRVALSVRKKYPERVAVGVKQSMGQGDWTFSPGDGEEYTPSQVSAEVLKTLISDAERHLGEEVEELVVTVPAYFEEPQRNDTLEAAVLAGIPADRVRLLEEPQAAALAYCIDNATRIRDEYFVVYDLGGGTFDVALVHAHTGGDGNGQLQVDTLIKAGNAQLGGLQWDDKMAELVADKMQSKQGTDPREDPQDEAILMENAEDGKRKLSRISPVSVISDRTLNQVEVTRTEFEEVTSDLLFETRQLLEQVLDDAETLHQVPRDRIQVLMAGGSTRMPMVEEMIAEVTGNPPIRHGNPDFLVAMGAAYWANPGDEIHISTVTHYAVGIECWRADDQENPHPYNAVMLPHGSTLGPDGDVEREFFKNEDNMKEVRIILYKSLEDTENISECKEMACFRIGPLPDGGRKGERVRVTLGHTEDGILHGDAQDLVTGKKVDIEIERSAIDAT